MVLLRTSYICTGTSSNTILDYNLVRFGVCMIKLRHERMLIIRCILPPPPPNNWITSRKKVNPPATTWKISNILTRNSSHWEYLNPMRNLELLEKYPPRNLSIPLNKLNTSEIILTPPEKIPNTSESISIPQKKFKPLPEKSQPHWKTPPPQK